MARVILISVQPPRSTRSSSLVTLSRPPTSNSLRAIWLLLSVCLALSLESTPYFPPSTSSQSVYLWLACSCSYHIFSLCRLTTLTTYNSLILSLVTQDLHYLSHTVTTAETLTACNRYRFKWYMFTGRTVLSVTQPTMLEHKHCLYNMISINRKSWKIYKLEFPGMAGATRCKRQSCPVCFNNPFYLLQRYMNKSLNKKIIKVSTSTASLWKDSQRRSDFNCG